VYWAYQNYFQFVFWGKTTEHGDLFRWCRVDVRLFYVGSDAAECRILR